MGFNDTQVAQLLEPAILATILVPEEYLGPMMDLCASHRGEQIEYYYLEGSTRVFLRYKLPLSEIVSDFFDKLKSRSSGFASFDYEEAGYIESDLVKVSIIDYLRVAVGIADEDVGFFDWIFS